MKVVPLTKGKTALVDDSDFEFISQFSWCYVATAGAQTRIGKKRVLMHRLLMNPPQELTVDHINHDRLDNRRANLRLATAKQQSQNKRGWGRSYKGVSDITKSPGYKPNPNARPGLKRIFRAQIHHNGRYIGCGSHFTAEEAARAYDRKALELFGEFACINFPREKIS